MATTPLFSRRAVVLVESWDGSSTLIIVGHKDGDLPKCIMVTESKDGKPTRKEKLLSLELEAKIRNAVMSQLLQVRYAEDAGKTAISGGIHFVVGATDPDRPFKYFMGDCVSDGKSFRWLIELTAIIRDSMEQDSWALASEKLSVLFPEESGKTR